MAPGAHIDRLLGSTQGQCEMNELISTDYRAQNQDLHQEGLFGVSGYKWAPTVSWLIRRYGILHVLDYGAGQQTLKKALENLKDIHVECYDPAIPELSKLPIPADLLTCTDVLEHIEPDYIDDVLNHIQSLTSKLVLLVIPTGPASKFLPDGRNAHLIQKPLQWWLPKLMSRFEIVSLNNQTEDIVFVGVKKSNCNGLVDEELFRQLEFFRYDRILSIAFDGYSINISIKSNRIINRIIPRIISILKLGSKSGVSTRKKGVQHAPSINLTFW